MIALPLAYILPGPFLACLYDFGKVYRRVLFPAGSQFAVGMDDVYRVDAEVAADDGFWSSTARRSDC